CGPACVFVRVCACACVCARARAGLGLTDTEHTSDGVCLGAERDVFLTDYCHQRWLIEEERTCQIMHGAIGPGSQSGMVCGGGGGV
uniref:Uncharacterized protein n=1 Tax=Esox lucius TaxID=8010 RepID=A0A6Q2XP17_ESOLU